MPPAGENYGLLVCSNKSLQGQDKGSVQWSEVAMARFPVKYTKKEKA
ncbi:MAG: hypothetical protein LBQ24_02490 [Candidatus Peribacteria bacterium]|nr:hypothetical protein [Candidatus Peribacteria bacterium]